MRKISILEEKNSKEKRISQGECGEVKHCRDIIRMGLPKDLHLAVVLHLLSEFISKHYRINFLVTSLALAMMYLCFSIYEHYKDLKKG